MLIASYCKTILLTSTDTEVQKNIKSGIEMLYNSYTLIFNALSCSCSFLSN